MDRKPYVIFIPYSYPDSNHKMRGVFFKEQAAGLVKSGCDVDVVCVWAVSFREIFKFTKFIGLSERKDESGVNVWIYFFPALPQMNIFNLRISNFILKRLLKKKMQQRTLPDVLHMHVFSSGKAVREISKEYKIPYIYTEHFSIFSKTRIHSYIEHSVRDNLTYSACNTAVGHNLAEFMENRYDASVKYIPNFIDTNFFNLSPRERKDGILNLIAIGSLIKIKNHQMLLESFAKAFSGQDKIKLTIVGDGDERRRLEELTKELGIENQVVYSGKAERDTIKELLHSADGLVHSSSYETFGVVLIEALSCGLPVLSTRNGGAESILISEDCGILSESDVDNYAANLQQFVKKIKNSEYDKFVIRNYVVENFSISKVAVQYRHLYSDITRRK